MENEKETLSHILKTLDTITTKFLSVLVTLEEMKTVTKCNNKELRLHTSMIENVYADLSQFSKQINDIIIEVQDMKGRLDACE